jgi:phospholipase C
MSQGEESMKRRSMVAACVAATFTMLAASATSAAAGGHGGGQGKDSLAGIKHIVVIYEENHSFDNLYGGWEGVNGLKKADAAHTTQVNTSGVAYDCLKQDDVNLTSPPLASTCSDASAGTPGGAFDSAFANKPFRIDNFIGPIDTTCPPPLQAFSFPNGVVKGAGLPGGCTRDLVHRFYQEQYQIDGGKQDRYVTGSDAIGLTMGTYDTKQLPIYKYLHSNHAPSYAIEDNFFQAAFGGSFLNHQWLIAARTPEYPGAPDTLNTILGADGSPANYPLHPATGLRDGALTVAKNADGTCSAPAQVCGEFAVNTMQPPFAPFSAFGAQLKVAQTYDTIGDRLSGKGIDWAWYSGGWDDATGNPTGVGYTNGPGPTCGNPNASPSAYPVCPDNVFQYHHQPFNYFANYAPGTQARADHLRDEAEFIAAAKKGTLKPVSFVKPLGEENEHPGYASESQGSDHLVDLIKAIVNGPDGKNTMIVVTYDEFGGQWDHVSPPTGRGVSDVWGPGTRVPALIISSRLHEDFSVDHVQHDTTSILATIEHFFHLKPLTSRDASVADLSSAFREGHHN